MGNFKLLSQRLSWAIERKHDREDGTRIKKADIARVVERSPVAVGYWFNDVNGIDAENARKLGAFLGVNPVWLETGEGNPDDRRAEDRTNGTGHNSAYAHYNAGPELDLRQGRYVAIVGIGQGGADGYLSIDDYAPGQGDGYIYTYSPDPNAYAIRVRGDSMRPRIKSGEFIVAEPGIEAQPGDDVVVKLTNDKAMVKELLWVRDSEISLGSINAAVAPITIDTSEVASIHRVAAIVPRGSALLKAR